MKGPVGTMTVEVDGIPVQVEIHIDGTAEVQNINGEKQLMLFLKPVFPWDGPSGGGEPLPIEDAA